MATATYEGEQITVDFSATMERSWHPSWDEITDITIDRVTILGVECELKDLPPKLRSALHDLADELEFDA